MRTGDDHYITKEQFQVLMMRISRGSHVPEDTILEMVESAWPSIAPEGRLTFRNFQKQLSYFDLHSLMTIDF